jgi:hypothetical protein
MRGLIIANGRNFRSTIRLSSTFPSNYKVSKYAARLLYVYAITMFFIRNPLPEGFENETRYVMKKVFNISATSKDLSMYIDRLKRGGTRRKLSFNHDDDLYL